MIFSSTLFLFRFLPIFMILYFVAPGRMKNFILFFGSLVFYAWGEPIYVCLMIFSTISDYLHGLAIHASRSKTVRKILLISSIIINLGMLGFFKYADFLVGAVNSAFGLNIPLLNLPLPIGISFYTFQTMSYTIDVYRGGVKVQKNLLDFGVFVTLFPQLIAGPIVKYVDVQNDLGKRKPDILQISYGSKRFIIGLAKKVLLANNLGLIWNEISARDFGELNIVAAWIGIIAFAFQIYFDFSGYSDMAIGLGACLGFTFPENFNYPYISVTITEFWRRWHMTLSSWFREYVYIPLGGNRKGLPRQLLNILIVWTLTGIWHGAGWNFLFWGLWFAFWLMLEKIGLKKVFEVLPRFVGRVYTLFVVLISWVFFSVESVDRIINYIKAMFGLQGAGIYNRETLFMGMENAVLFVIAVIAATPLVKNICKRMSESQKGFGIAGYRILEKLLPAILLIASIAYIVDATYNPFLYFRF